ncbi:MAG: M18 family aminopeptidase [Eubacteriales bacterium]
MKNLEVEKEVLQVTSEEKQMTQELLSFIKKSPTCFHAIQQAKEKVKAEGFVELKEQEPMNVVKGGKYFITRNDSSMIAFVIPTEKAIGFHIAASHSDAPCFKLKEKPEIVAENKYVKLNVENYGGMILSTWLDRPLSVAGRVIVKENGQLQSKLVQLKDNSCIIPNVAIHFNREMNNGIKYNPQVDMQPLFSGKTNSTVREMIASECNIEEAEILGSDLFLYNSADGCMVGVDEEFVCAPRLDDLQCAFTSLEGFLQAKPAQHIAMCAIFDNEEVGSSTRQGADSDFLDRTIERIVNSLGDKDVTQMLAGSFMLSADNAHGVHPNHGEKSDPTNRPYLNHGVVIKFHGSQKYTTDGYSAAMVRDFAEEAGVNIQTFANRSDMPGGSTLGNISTKHVSISSADVGLPQLAMHSALETAGTKDTIAMVKLMEVFFSK